MESWISPMQPSELPNASRILVLAPHADDEIFGCGGLLARYIEQGSEVHVHIFTDGAAILEAGQSAEELSQRRVDESRSALSVLGDHHLSYSRFPDRSLAKLPQLSHEVGQLQKQIQANLILLPSFHEIHPDHLALVIATQTALNQNPELFGDALFLFYEVSAPLQANMLIDISTVWQRKEMAMEQFRSQLDRQAYKRQIAGLNIYRTYTLPKDVLYTEAYVRMTADEFREKDLSSMRIGYSQTGPLLKAYVEHQAMTEHMAALEQQLDEMRTSTSWRVTAPLRWMRQQFKKSRST